MSIEGFRSYAQEQVSAAQSECNVVKYKNQLSFKDINDLCYHISLSKGEGNLKVLTTTLREEINTLAPHSLDERDNLIKYTRKIIDIGNKYLMLNNN